MKSILKLFPLIAIFLFLANKSLKSQDFLSFAHDNYGGATSMFYQPANIADSRYKFDMEFMGLSTRIENNWWSLDPAVLYRLNSFKDSNFISQYLSPIDNTDNKFAFQSAEARILSFSLNLSEKSAFGFSIRARQIINFNNLDYIAANLVLNKNNDSSLYNDNLNFSDMSQSAVAWAEYGLTYSQVLINNKRNFFKVGITAKLLQGMGALYLYEDQLSYTYLNQDTALDVIGDVKFGATSNFEDITKYQFAANPAIGGDIGFVYEYRPHYDKYLYDMDGKTNLWRKDQNKYLFKVSFSVLDLGQMKFEKQFGSNDFFINQDTLDFGSVNVGNVTDLADSINANGQVVNNSPYFKYRLPTTINLDIDYRVANHFYVNVAGRLALNQGDKYYTKSNYINSVSFTPRYEAQWFGAALPMRYNQFKQFNVGLGLRLGPVWIGSNNLLGVTGLQKTITSADLYIAVKIPIMYKAPKDADKDKVSDELDECPYDIGKWEDKGCPDSDGDGIINKLDDCAYTAGLKEFNGCPDSDGDGVQDKYDNCPDISGSKLYAGCPDTDEDGIIDKNDSCPNNYGPAKYNGCPDTDGDSIPDNLDDCPEVKGLVIHNGCPDTDGDGIIDALDICPTVAGLDSLSGCPYVDTDNDGIQDKYDKCPKISGPKENNGCPYADSDNDSVPDKDDLCPMTPGAVSNAGCPVINKEEQEILNTAFNNLEFSNGKSVIKKSSYNSLDELAALLTKKEHFRLLIEGHTDNVGRETANLSLSQNRALAVKKYLVDKGIDKSRIDAKWYGETKPIADNNTAEGRAKNRRVEMKVIFD
jgi:outer membrane protein OmpA-like peptidoglycan-associated protein